MDKYQCIACSYEYDPAHGDPIHGIAAGTSFDDLPETWKCPRCHVSKMMFQRSGKKKGHY